MNKKYDNLDEYKMAVLSDCIKSTDIMKKITLPQSVYKYRRFDAQYLKESLDGNVFFSNPIDMNVNDPYDCKMKFDTKKILKTMFPEISSEICKKHPEILQDIKSHYKAHCALVVLQHVTALKLKCGIIHILVINTKDIVLSIELNRNIFILVLLFF